MTFNDQPASSFLNLRFDHGFWTNLMTPAVSQDLHDPSSFGELSRYLWVPAASCWGAELAGWTDSNAVAEGQTFLSPLHPPDR